MNIRLKLVFLLLLVILLAGKGAYPDIGLAAPNPAPVLSVTPNIAVPNQTVVLLGNGFTPATTPGGSAGAGAHQITGLGASVVIVGNTLLVGPNISYPINFDSLGNWATSITIPVTAQIAGGGPIEIKAVDDQGLTQSTQVTIRIPSITLDPASSSRSSDVTLTGDGFPASNPATTANVYVSISYAGSALKVVSPNISGEINTIIQVPTTAVIPSNNIVKATILGYSQSAIAIHSVPGASLTVSPTYGRPGTIVTVIGENYPDKTVVSGIRAGNISVTSSPAPVTDTNGKFVAFFAVPLFVPGVQAIAATAAGITAVTSFTVNDGPAIPQPTPIPTASTGAAQALETLTTGDNLVRVWNFDNGTKRWTFFDPRPAFSNANTIKKMEAGKLYWLQVNHTQSAMISGSLKLIYEGWNLINW